MSLGYGKVELQLLDELARDADSNMGGVVISKPGMERKAASSRRRAAKRLEEKGMCETMYVVCGKKRRLVCMTPEKALEYRRRHAVDQMANNKLERLQLYTEFFKLGLDAETWKPIEEGESD